MSGNGFVSTSRNRSGGFTAKRIVFDALMVAVFTILSAWVVVRFGNAIKITFDSIVLLLVAMMFSPVDAFIVGLLGEFLAQLLGPYGLEATTVIWIIPPAVRGLLFGLGVKLFPENMTLQKIWVEKKPYVYFAVVIVVSIVNSCLNTMANFVSSKIQGWYEYHVIFGVFWLRLGTGLLTNIVIAIVTIPVLVAIKKSKLVPLR